MSRNAVQGPEIKTQHLISVQSKCTGQQNNVHVGSARQDLQRDSGPPHHRRRLRELPWSCHWWRFCRRDLNWAPEHHWSFSWSFSGYTLNGGCLWVIFGSDHHVRPTVATAAPQVLRYTCTPIFLWPTTTIVYLPETLHILWIHMRGVTHFRALEAVCNMSKSALRIISQNSS